MNIRLPFIAITFGLFLGLTGFAWQVRAAPAAQTEPLRVVFSPLEPFAYEEDEELVGFSVDLWKAIADDLSLEYEWLKVDTITQQLEAVTAGSADIALGGISMTPEREEAVDFSYPYFNSGLLIITQPPGRESISTTFETFFSPNMLRVLGLALITLLVIAHVIWLLERGSNKEVPKAYLPGIWDGLWWAVATITTAEYVDGQKPRTPIKRLMAMFFMIAGIVLIAQFTAAITASLTVTELTGQIDGPSDLPGKSIATVIGTTSANYLEAENLPFTGVETIEEAYALLDAGEVDAVVFDAPVLLHYANTTGRGRVRVVGSIFEEDAYAFALPTNSGLRESINQSLLSLKNNGSYDSIYARWFQEQE
jgi:ABC-type amino acid transport substrate-binding protein